MAPVERPQALVVIGASAGGVEALIELAKRLPADLAAPVVVVIHRSATTPSVLANVLSRAGRLPVHDALDGEELRAGEIYLAPPDRHLLVSDGRVRTPRGARENGHRPAIDPLFRSAALVYGPAATAIVLTGACDDGAAGAAVISGRGGVVIVQDPAEAVQPSMPLHAIQADAPDHVVKRAAVAAPPVVALVGSAGALEAMAEVLEAFDPGFPAAVVVLLHLAPARRSVLAEILARRCALPVKQAAEGDMLDAGTVHVAPAGVHLVVRADGSLALDSRPPVHFLRPSVDMLLESMAAACGPRSVAVVLSGGGSDGALGAVALKAAGGTVIAQDETSSRHFAMPDSAIQAGAVDRVVPLRDIARTVMEYVEALPIG